MLCFTSRKAAMFYIQKGIFFFSLTPKGLISQKSKDSVRDLRKKNELKEGKSENVTHGKVANILAFSIVGCFILKL